MKRKTYKQMKDLGWDRFVEHVISKGMKPEDLLKSGRIVEIQTHLSVIKMAKDLEKALYGQP